MAKVAIVYHSGSGRTALVAERVLAGLQKVEGIDTLYLKADEATQNLDRLNDVDTIVLGTPTYMGDVAVPIKVFMEATGGIWFSQSWKDKLAAGFTNSLGLSGDKVHTLTTLSVFAAQHSMIWISQGLMAQADQNRLSSWLGLATQTDYQAPSPPAVDLETAEKFGQRIGEVTRRWVRGR
ncbi:MAG: flavodoxin family protein [Cyanobacteriota bacterium]|nr:flavodoxin family protein [Cyanobacteriota bacterium]